MNHIDLVGYINAALDKEDAQRFADMLGSKLNAVVRECMAQVESERKQIVFAKFNLTTGVR